MSSKKSTFVNHTVYNVKPVMAFCNNDYTILPDVRDQNYCSIFYKGVRITNVLHRSMADGFIMGYEHGKRLTEGGLK